MMLLFILFGLKITSLFAAKTDTTSTHICADYDLSTNTTRVKWAVSSVIPVSVHECDLLYRRFGSSETAKLVNGLPSHGTTVLDELQPPMVWTIRVTCAVVSAEDGVRYSSSSPAISFIPGDKSSPHVCSDSGLSSLASRNSDIPLVLCIWRPEPDQNYAVVRWQPTSNLVLTLASCTVHRWVRGQTNTEAGFYVDDMQHYIINGNSLKAWVTCIDRGRTIYSGNATYMDGSTTACSSQITHSTTVGHTQNQPTEEPPHSTLGISNMAMGLSLAGGILIAAIILTIGFIKWFRWQTRRRRERLLTHGEPSTDQSAMEEFQQMV